VTRAETLKNEWDDEFVSVEHLLLALAEDTRVVGPMLRASGLDPARLEAATKDIRGSNRVTDQVGGPGDMGSSPR
jgi:ATP-dependent Clp protease ATP-binding subunit ClpB